MEQADILDNKDTKPLHKKLWTIRLLIIGGGLIALTFLIATFWETLGLDGRHSIWLPVSMMIAFGINVAGCIMGLTERKKNKRRALVGILGNLLLILFFLAIVGYSISTMQEV